MTPLWMPLLLAYFTLLCVICKPAVDDAVSRQLVDLLKKELSIKRNEIKVLGHYQERPNGLTSQEVFGIPFGSVNNPGEEDEGELYDRLNQKDIEITSDEMESDDDPDGRTPEVTKHIEELINKEQMQKSEPPFALWNAKERNQKATALQIHPLDLIAKATIEEKNMVDHYSEFVQGIGCVVYDGSLVSSMEGTLTSVGYPESYDNHSDKCWGIGADGQDTTLTFDPLFNVEDVLGCTFDYIVIHYINSNNADYGPLCGTVAPQPITIHQQAVLRFHTDFSATSAGFKVTLSNGTIPRHDCQTTDEDHNQLDDNVDDEDDDFDLDIHDETSIELPNDHLPNSIECINHETYYGVTSAVIQSNNYPNVYSNNRDDCWIIGTEGQDTTLTFSQLFHVGADCSGDWLSVYTDLTEVPTFGPFCGSGAPAAIRLHGGALVYFHTDTNHTFQGFEIHVETENTDNEWDTVPDLTPCMLLNGNGSIISEGFNNLQYPNGHRACWIIGNLSQSVNLVFQEFELEYHGLCMFDSLRVSSESPDGSGFIQEDLLCGVTHPDHLNFPVGAIKLEFKTDDSEVAKGFEIHYDTYDGVEVVECVHTNRSEGTIAILPYDYQNNIKKCWTIYADVGMEILIRFVSMDIEVGTDGCNYDVLKVRDGAGVDMEICGSEVPGDFVSTSGEVVIEFLTDASSTFDGFSLDYRRQLPGVLQCSQQYNETGVLQTPNYPNGYQPNTHVCITINSADGHPVTLSLDTVAMQNSLGCIDDYVLIYDGTLQSGTVIQRLCSPLTDGEVITATSGVMTLEFYANSDEFVGHGVMGAFRTVPLSDGDGMNDDLAGCSGVPLEFTGDEGTITVQGDDGEDYRPNLDCKFTITVPVGKRIIVRFTEFDLEAGSKCTFDYVALEEDGIMLAKSCGTEAMELYSWRNIATLHFITDGNVGGRGFIARYSSITTNVNEVTTPSCGTLQQLRNHGASTRIVGGTEAMPHDWPWQIRLTLRGGHGCGGSIVSEYHILTAAHCILENTGPNDYTVVVGEHNRRIYEGTERHYHVEQIISHTGYNIEHPDNNDIAVIRVKTPIQWSSAVLPVCIPQNDPNVGTASFATGWGDTKDTGDNMILREVDLQVLENDPNWREGILRPEMLVAGTKSGGKDACQGDSGGPLVFQNSRDGPWMLAGVTSFGFGCGVPGDNGVYARVTAFSKWIHTHTNSSIQTVH